MTSCEKELVATVVHSKSHKQRKPFYGVEKYIDFHTVRHDKMSPTPPGHPNLPFQKKEELITRKSLFLHKLVKSPLRPRATEVKSNRTRNHNSVPSIAEESYMN